MTQPATTLDIDSFIKRAAAKIRMREAETLRGQPEELQKLEQRPDAEVVARWAWTSAIVGAVTTFFAWFAVGTISHFVPPFLTSFLWLLIKLGMVVVSFTFGSAAWLTFGHLNKGSNG